MARLNPTAATAFARWLAETHPDLFLAAYHLAAFGATPQTTGLGDISDFLSSVGSTVSDAVSSVGSWLTNPTNIQSITGLASSYLNSQSQANIVNAQIARAQASQPPLPVQYTQNASGQYVPVVPIGSNGQVVSSASSPAIAGFAPVTSSMFAASSMSAQLMQFLPWIAAAGFALLMLRRR